MEKLAALTGIAPLMTRDHLKMARKNVLLLGQGEARTRLSRAR